MTSSLENEFSPAITQTKDGRIWLLWHMYASGKSQIFYKTYDGAWSTGTQLTTHLSNNINPAFVQAQDGKIWVFWSSDRNGPSGNWEIYYKTSSDNGVSWSGDTRLTIDAYTDGRPAAMQAQDGKIWAFWYSDRTGNDDIYYSYYDGTWASLGIQLTTDPTNDKHPAVFQAQDGKFWVFWTSYRTGDYELWYRASVDNGVSWSSETQLTVESSSWDEFPSAIQAQDGKIWVAWMADRGGGQEPWNIFYKTYSGSIWSSDVQIVSDNDNDWHPSLCQSKNATIWLAWSTSRNGDYDVYYKKTLADYDVAVKSVTSPSALAYQGYTRQVQVGVKNEGLQPATFTVTAYYNSTPIGTQSVTSLASKAQTTLTFQWDTTMVPYGKYTLSATASGLSGEEDLTDNSLSGDTVKMTIPGDVNGDQEVDVVDAASNSAHWYPGPPIGPLSYGLTNDINTDGKVDIVDSAIVSSHWNQAW